MLVMIRLPESLFAIQFTRMPVLLQSASLLAFPHPLMLTGGDTDLLHHLVVQRGISESMHQAYGSLTYVHCVGERIHRGFLCF